MQMVNIEDKEIPVAVTKSKYDFPFMITYQGIININITEDFTLEEAVRTGGRKILELYNSQTKSLVYRSEEEYTNLCARHFIRYEKELMVEAKEIIHTPFALFHLGFAYNDYTVLLNHYLQYLEDETVEYTIYHELCHLHTLKYCCSFSHNPEFYDILYQQYSPLEIKKIMEC